MTPSMALVPERTIEVDSDFYVAVFTTHGARLKSFVLNSLSAGRRPRTVRRTRWCRCSRGGICRSAS